ncbi:hypothetical protein [Streptomyces antimicrobicus]|uniref:Uncharacterized protein n=1 Tax=Streptomyces antimicrobicus TaxID=2883108 RepID=A0ABS8BEY5_9ACTN|nr:hypothetical protein [Streptomyces antimicrobicus]MCB5183172.1 hypothetical protein [Streptomyces antimicrobicus]
MEATRPSRRWHGGAARSTRVAAGLSMAVGAVLAGVLVAPPAAAVGGPADGGGKAAKNDSSECRTSRTVSSERLDFGVSAEFRVATDRKGNAYLNDDRNPGIWVNLDILEGTPECVIGSAVGTDESPATVTLTLLSKSGKLYAASCAITATPFTAANLEAACGAGFTLVPGTPV